MQVAQLDDAQKDRDEHRRLTHEAAKEAELHKQTVELLKKASEANQAMILKL